MSYPEFAQIQPLADPRTVQFYCKRNFLETSSDHIPEEQFWKNKKDFNIKIRNKLKAQCDKNTFLRLKQTNNSISKLVLNASTISLSSSALSSSSLSPRTSESSITLLLSSASASTKSSSNNLVKFYNSCHLLLNKLFINNLQKTNLYKFQKTKLNFFLILFICCAIFLHLPKKTQAIPARRVSTSGHKLIYHTNSNNHFNTHTHSELNFKSDYHQKALPALRHPRQQRLRLLQQEQLGQSVQQPDQILQRQKLHQTKPKIKIYKPFWSLHHTAPRSLRRSSINYYPRLHHHLHQRAAPQSLTTKMSCKPYYEKLRNQVIKSLPYIKQLADDYANTSKNESSSTTFEEAIQPWLQHNLQLRNAGDDLIGENSQHDLHKLYQNLTLLEKLIIIVEEETETDKLELRHRQFMPDEIIANIGTLKSQVKHIRGEMEDIYHTLDIEMPNYPKQIIYNKASLNYEIRILFIYKELIDLCEEILKVICNEASEV